MQLNCLRNHWPKSKDGSWGTPGRAVLGRGVAGAMGGGGVGCGGRGGSGGGGGELRAVAASPKADSSDSALVSTPAFRSSNSFRLETPFGSYKERMSKPIQHFFAYHENEIVK